MWKILVALFIAGVVLVASPSTASYNAPIEVKRPLIREYAQQMVLETFGGGWAEFNEIIQKESRWEVFGHHYPVTKLSSAHGLCGIIDGTWKMTGYKKTDDPYIQVNACIVYLQKTYKTPQKALAAHLQKGWW